MKHLLIQARPEALLCSTFVRARIEYTRTTFAVLRLFRLMPILLNLDKEIQEKLARLFKKLDLSPAPGLADA